MVLPTPPEPQHTTMARSVTSSAASRHSPARRGCAGHGAGRAVSAAGRPGPRSLGHGRRHGVVVGQPPTAGPAAASVELGADPGAEQEGRLQLGQGQLGGEPGPLLLLQGEAPWPGRPPPGAGPSAWSGVRRHARPPAAASAGSTPEPVVGGQAGVDDDRPELDADAVLEGVRGLDHLVDRHLLGQGDERHLAALGIRQQLDHVGRLRAHRARPGRVEQALGRGQEGHGVPGGGGVHQDEVGGPLALEALHLAEHEDVADAGDGRGHHVEGPRGDQALGDPLHAVVGQVLEQGVVGGDAPGPDGAADRSGRARRRRRRRLEPGQDGLVVGRAPPSARRRRTPRACPRARPPGPTGRRGPPCGPGRR